MTNNELRQLIADGKLQEALDHSGASDLWLKHNSAQYLGDQVQIEEVKQELLNRIAINEDVLEYMSRQEDLHRIR